MYIECHKDSFGRRWELKGTSGGNQGKLSHQSCYVTQTETVYAPTCVLVALSKGLIQSDCKGLCSNRTCAVSRW